MPAGVEAGASVVFAAPLALVELCVLTEAIDFLGVLAAADAGGITRMMFIMPKSSWLRMWQ